MIYVNKQTLEEVGCDVSASERATVVYYDFDVEDNPEEESEVWESIERVERFFINCGYQKIFENDGSGNGMIYGGIVFDK